MDGADTAKTGKRVAAKSTAATATKTVNLALQGGGAHGAFTWGVLDRLAEDERIEIEGISATSAGAMNTTVFASGYTKGGRAGARQALNDFWKRNSVAASDGPLQPSWFDRLTGYHSLQFSPAFMAFDLMTRLFSPYEFNPGNTNPLREVLSASVDFAAINGPDCPLKLFLSATNVRSGKVKIFDKGNISVEATLASACLPFLFQAVEVEGEHYWDGGYMGNPAIYPLIYHCESK